MKSLKDSYSLGGMMRVQGPRHEEGGVPLGNAEVEGGETIQDIGKGKYVFSDRLKVPGSRETFAQRHAAMTKEKASPRDILRLVKIQERLNGPPQQKMFTGGLLEGAAIYGPGLINIARGIFGKSKTPAPRLMDRGSLDYLKQMDTSVNVDPQLNEIRTQTRSIGADPAASTAQKLIAQANAMRQTSGVLAQKENMETGFKNEKLGALARQTAYLDAQDQQTLTAHDDMRMRASAARENLIGAGLSQLSSTFQQQNADKIGMAAATASMNPDDRAELLFRLGLGPKPKPKTAQGAGATPPIADMLPLGQFLSRFR